MPIINILGYHMQLIRTSIAASNMAKKPPLKCKQVFGICLLFGVFSSQCNRLCGPLDMDVLLETSVLSYPQC
jgi:hypothetical protein